MPEGDDTRLARGGVGVSVGSDGTVHFGGPTMPHASPSPGAPDALATGIAKASGPSPDTMVAPNGISIEIGSDGFAHFLPPKSPSIKRRRKPTDFTENLVDQLGDNAIATIGEDYLDGVAMDILSRSEFIANYNRGVDLLGLKIEEASSTRGPRRSISKIKDPTMLEAVVRYNSGARAELLPAAGPVKISIIGGSSAKLDLLARDFESDFNYYLTDIAKEYYPDTDRMLIYQGFGGSAYKKIFRDPLRRRPVSESINLTNLIVSENATDLENAIRITHEIMMSPQQVKRMQLFGGWSDVNLGQPMGQMSAARRKILETQGIAPVTSRPQDQQYTIYEGYTDIDLGQYGIDEWAPEGLALPYRMTMDRDSRRIVDLRRNWKEGDEEFIRKRTFVKYGMVPGLGFLDWGFLHLLGNQSRALTAIWQILVDGGMLSNFPGGLRAKGVRTSTNEITPGLGEFVDVDLGQFDDIRKAIMAMPYKDVSSVFIQLADLIQKGAQRMGGAMDLETGEGRTNVPVGTIMALIEQQTQIMSSVHKRNHTSQKDELLLIRDLFAENPKDLWRLARNPARQWETAEEFINLDLSPASDPNVASQMHRIMQATNIEQMAKDDVINIDRKAVHRRTFTSFGINDGDSLLFPGPGAPPPPPPSLPPPSPPGLEAGIKAKLDAPFKQAQTELEKQKLQVQMVQQQREAAAQAEESRQREQDRASDDAVHQDELDLERERLAKEHTENLTGLVLEHKRHQEELAQADRHHSQGLAQGGLGTGL